MAHFLSPKFFRYQIVANLAQNEAKIVTFRKDEEKSGVLDKTSFLVEYSKTQEAEILQ